MKCILLFLLLAGIFPAVAQSNRVARPKVAVVVFENFTNTRKPVTIDNPALTPSRLPILGTDMKGKLKINTGITIESYGERARSLLEHELSRRPEIELLDRQRIELIQMELDLNRARGGRRHLDEQIAKQHGADFLVIGEILDFSTDTSVFEGYGLALNSETVSAEIYVRVIKVASEAIVFSAEQIGTVDRISTQFAHSSRSDSPAAALGQAVRQLARTTRFLDVFVEKVQAEILPRPAADRVKVQFKVKGAAVELDGVHVGTAPLTRLLVPDLEYQVKLSKPGYRTWEARIIAEQKLVIAPALEPIEK